MQKSHHELSQVWSAALLFVAPYRHPRRTLNPFAILGSRRYMSQKKGKQLRSKYFNIALVYKADKRLSILFVHGLQGHPKNTWTSKSAVAEGANSTKVENEKRPRRRLKFWSSNASTAKSTGDLEKPDTFWPYHLLPNDCKNARILTWGYNSNVSEFFKGSANKGTILSHSRDLLGDLTGDERGSSV